MAKTVKAPHNSFAQTQETLGSIVFALILALVFRGFVGQAFVIPTGSMAPTLYGAHMDHVCSDCGYHFALGLDHPPTRAYCPNCDHSDLLTEQILPDAGDGIFTLSWPFAVGRSLAPQRWDVVVFKAPFRINSSTERDGETNYIKRLIGLPGDVIEIIDGDLYQARAADIAEPVRAKLLHAPLPLALTPEERKDLDSRLQIVRKTPAAQEALWQVLFDADYSPIRTATPEAPIPGWKPAGDARQSKWTTTGRIFRFEGKDDQPQYIELTGKDFRDNYGYNGGGGMQIVSDLRIGATVNWQGGDGIVRLCLSKYEDVYTIELRPRQGSGRAMLTQRVAPGSQPDPTATPQAEQQLGEWTFPLWRRNQPVRVTFADVDRRLEVRINGRLAWQREFAQSAGQAKRHSYETMVPLVQIGCAGGKAEVSHLLVNRDVYYQDVAPLVTFEVMPDGSGKRRFNEYSDKPGWATRDNPMLLGDKEYFALGDNSPASLDSRRWWQKGKHLEGRPEDYRRGTIPSDQMIGKAFFVYWPSWYRLWDIPGLRVIPNIGEMRWIQ
jgi:signal peptidase I